MIFFHHLLKFLGTFPLGTLHPPIIRQVIGIWMNWVLHFNPPQKPPLPEPKSLSSTSEELEDRMRCAESFQSSQGHLSSFFWTVELSHWPDLDWRNSIDSQMERVWGSLEFWTLDTIILWVDLEFLWGELTSFVHIRVTS